MPSILYPSRLTAVGGDLSQTRKQKKIPLNIATWNVRTLIDQDDTDRPHRRTTFIASELARYKIDIGALSETRLADKGELTD